MYTRHKFTILFTETSNYATIVMFRRQWHSASLMSKYSVSEHVIQNLVHRAQSIALDLCTHIFYKFRVPNSHLVRAHSKNVTTTYIRMSFPLTWVRGVTKFELGSSQHPKVFDTSLQGRSSYYELFIRAVCVRCHQLGQISSHRDIPTLWGEKSGRKY